MLELVDVHTYYAENHILRGISMEVKAGSVVALLGRNGMGKTTTVRSIIGFTPPRSGVVRFKGKDISGLPSYQICQMGLALAPQGRADFSFINRKRESDHRGAIWQKKWRLVFRKSIFLLPKSKKTS